MVPTYTLVYIPMRLYPPTSTKRISWESRRHTFYRHRLNIVLRNRFRADILDVNRALVCSLSPDVFQKTHRISSIHYNLKLCVAKKYTEIGTEVVAISSWPIIQERQLIVAHNIAKTAHRTYTGHPIVDVQVYGQTIDAFKACSITYVTHARPQHSIA
ncbi:hypothetical protein E4T56_gene3279 [Termitomyces sp. T112]|nr:hypothetical protein E4T56_gene3279 [Termitomyces sp. T112]